MFNPFAVHRTCSQGKIVIIMDNWTFVIFLGAADCELRGSHSEQVNSDGDCSRDDPPRMGSVQSIEANPRHSAYNVFPGDDFPHPHCLHLQLSQESIGYVDAG